MKKILITYPSTGGEFQEIVTHAMTLSSIMQAMTDALTSSTNQPPEKKESSLSPPNLTSDKTESSHVINQSSTRLERILPQLKTKLIEPREAVSFIPSVPTLI